MLFRSQAYVNMPREPIPALFWTACFSFAPAEMVERVPFDDKYPYLFLGEEICMNLRLYTHGFNVYGPTQHILYHIESRDYRPTFWELFHANKMPANASFAVTDEDRAERKALHAESIKRMAQLIYNHPHHDIPDQYGLGVVRSYEQFCKFIGIDFQKQQAKEHTRYGRTEQPGPEELYAKVVKNTAVVLAPPYMAKMPARLQQLSQPNVRVQQGRMLMKPVNMQNQMGNKRGQNMTKMTGLTGGAMFDPAQAPKQKQIPRTRTGPSGQNKPWLRQTQSAQVRPHGPPQARSYAQGMWGKP